MLDQHEIEVGILQKNALAFMGTRAGLDAKARAEQAAQDLFVLAAELHGAISGEHGIGLVKGGQLPLQWAPPVIALHEQIKRVFDPKGLLNPGKKLARA